jgi:hypothetical protein
MRRQFVPGLSALATSAQILAWTEYRATSAAGVVTQAEASGRSGPPMFVGWGDFQPPPRPESLLMRLVTFRGPRAWRPHTNRTA